MSKFIGGVVIDTETNAKADFDRSADAEGQPRLAQLALLLISHEGEVQGERNFYIVPDGWSMTEESTAINGLTDAFLREAGVPIEHALKAYSQIIRDGRFVVAHHAQYDCKVMRGELRRAGMPDLFEETPNICTMRKSGGVILKEVPVKDKVTGAIIGTKLTKQWPSLDRCRDVLGISKEGNHRGMKDAADTLAVYRHLLAQGVDLSPEVHHHADVESIRRAS